MKSAPVPPSPFVPPNRAPKRRTPVGLFSLLLLMAGIFYAAALLGPSFIRSRASGRLTGCKSQLKKIGAAMENHAADSGGKYPESVGQLVPRYLDAAPLCPVTRTSTYRAYVGADAPHNQDASSGYYWLACEGANHTAAGIEGNFPAYGKRQGLAEGPPARLGRGPTAE